MVEAISKGSLVGKERPARFADVLQSIKGSLHLEDTATTKATAKAFLAAYDLDGAPTGWDASSRTRGGNIFDILPLGVKGEDFVASCRRLVAPRKPRSKK